MDIIRDNFIELYKYGAELAGSFIDDLIEATTNAIRAASLYPSSWEASSYWLLVNQFCELFDLPLSTNYLQSCAENNEWLNFLTFCELFQYSVVTVAPIVENFSHPHIRENMYLLLQIMKISKKDASRSDIAEGYRSIRSNLYSRIGVIAASDKTTSASSDDDLPKMSKAEENERADVKSDGLVAILMNAQKSLHPWKELIQYSLEMEVPIYAMIAAGEPGVNHVACFCALLFVGLSVSFVDVIFGIRKKSELNSITVTYLSTCRFPYLNSVMVWFVRIFT